jgi:transposase
MDQLRLLEPPPEVEPGDVVAARKAHVRVKRIFRKADPEGQLYPSQFDYAVAKDHPVRHLKTLIDEIDLSFVEESYSDCGGVGYDPRPLLAVVIYGFSQGHRSSRELEELCLYDMRYRFLSEGLTPDDRTFGRFLLRIAPHMDRLMLEMNKLAKGKGKLPMREAAVDGCRLPSQATSWWSYRSKSEKPPTDPDAKVMDSHGRKMLGYNAQISVDLETGLICGSHVTNSQSDWHEMPAAIEAMKAQSGDLPSVVTADQGYECADSIQALERAGVATAIVFRADLREELSENAEGELVCPAGHPLILIRTTNNKGRVYDVYRPNKCTGCPLRPTCGFARKDLQVPTGTDPGARFRNRERARSFHASTRAKRRAVETPFAVLRRTFRSFTRVGLAKARVDFGLWCIAYNLLKLATDAVWWLKSWRIRLLEALFPISEATHGIDRRRSPLFT